MDDQLGAKAVIVHPQPSTGALTQSRSRTVGVTLDSSVSHRNDSMKVLINLLKSPSRRRRSSTFLIE
jgi:hypothetical protein